MPLTINGGVQLNDTQSSTIFAVIQLKKDDKGESAISRLYAYISFEQFKLDYI